MISQCRLDVVVTPLAKQVQHGVKQQIIRIERLITHTQQLMLSKRNIYLAMARGCDVFINNTVQAYFLTSTPTNPDTKNQTYNVAVADRITLNQLFEAIQLVLKVNDINHSKSPIYSDFRTGDVRHSQADVRKIKTLLGYAPALVIQEGIAVAMPCYKQIIEVIGE